MEQSNSTAVVKQLGAAQILSTNFEVSVMWKTATKIAKSVLVSVYYFCHYLTNTRLNKSQTLQMIKLQLLSVFQAKDDQVFVPNESSKSQQTCHIHKPKQCEEGSILRHEVASSVSTGIQSVKLNHNLIV